MQQVFAIPVLDRWLVHAPLAGMTAVTNRAAMLEMLETEVQAEPAARTGEVDPQFFGIVTTRACNMACVYCGFAAAAEGEHMDLRLAAAGVDWMAGHAARTGRATLDVHFFGGEPMAAPEVVEVAVHRGRARAAELALRPQFEIATGGAFNETRARFLGDYISSVVLSFDGFPRVQNAHRPLGAGHASFERVARAAGILRDSPTELCLRICVADDNVEQLEETVDWFCEEWRPSTIDVETLRPVDGCELRPPDPYVFAAHFVAARRAAARHGVRVMYSAADTSRARTTFCPVGNDALILLPDGTVRACYLPEWKLGRFTREGLQLDDGAVARVRQLTMDKPRCASCFCRWSCAGGCHARPQDQCEQTRLVTACLLLEELDQGAWVDALLADRSAAERVAHD